MKYELWATSPYGTRHDARDTYRWRWHARLVAWWRTSRLIRWEVRVRERDA